MFRAEGVSTGVLDGRPVVGVRVAAQSMTSEEDPERSTLCLRCCCNGGGAGGAGGCPSPRVTKVRCWG